MKLEHRETTKFVQYVNELAKKANRNRKLDWENTCEYKSWKKRKLRHFLIVTTKRNIWEEVSFKCENDI